jgi:hypothetical protein
MEKILDSGSWGRLRIAIAPSLLFVGSLTFLLGLHHEIPNTSVGLWMAGLLLGISTVVFAAILEELVGRFESKVDGYLYPRMRARCKLWSAMVPKRKVHPDTYMHHFNSTWEAYLDSTPPAERTNRWDYYESLAQRYRVVMTIALSAWLAGLLWVYFCAFVTPNALSPVPYLSRFQIGFAGSGLLLVAVLILLVEIPSTAWILHWHRIRLVRALRQKNQCIESKSSRDREPFKPRISVRSLRC